MGKIIILVHEIPIDSMFSGKPIGPDQIIIIILIMIIIIMIMIIIIIIIIILIM